MRPKVKQNALDFCGLDGFRTIFNTRALLGIMVGASVTMLALGAVNVMLVPLVVNDLKSA